MNLEKQLPDITKSTVIACTASVVLLTIVLLFTRQFFYLYLIWNLFLAWVPLYIACFLEFTKAKWKVLTLIAAWLVFFPNAPYIITDLVHLGQNHKVPFWADALLLFSFGWSGLILGIISLLKVHAAINRYLTPVLSWVVMSGFIALSGFGIYLGRVERYNSWDIIANPFGLLKDVVTIITHPADYPTSIIITMAFFLFLLTAYTSVYLLFTKQKVHA